MRSSRKCLNGLRGCRLRLWLILWSVARLVCFWSAGRVVGRLRLKFDDTRAETRLILSAKRTSPFKSAGASVQLTTGGRGVPISCSNAGYTMFRGSVKSTSYPLHSLVSSSLPLPCVTVCHHISTGLYLERPAFIQNTQSFIYTPSRNRTLELWQPVFNNFRLRKKL
jgi:hypothetical protein